jgi:hypothetical protein
MEGTKSFSKRALPVLGQLGIVVGGTIISMLIYEWWKSRKVKAPMAAAPTTAPAPSPTTGG